MADAYNLQGMIRGRRRAQLGIPGAAGRIEDGYPMPGEPSDPYLGAPAPGDPTGAGVPLPPTGPSGTGIGQYGEGGGFTGNQPPGPGNGTAPPLAPPGVGSYLNTAGYSGWEGPKLTDPGANSLKYQVGRILSGIDPSQWNAAMQALAPLGITSVDPQSGKIRMPDGEIVDIHNSGGGWWWGSDKEQGTGPYAPGGAVGASGASGAGGGSSVPSGGGGAPGVGGGAPPGIGGQSWQQVLRGIYSQTPGEILNNPALVAQQNYTDYASQRQRERLMSQIAERNAAQGLGDSGANAAEQDTAGIDLAERTTGIQSQMAYQALRAEEARIMQALQMAQQYGMSQESNALQAQLAQIQAALQQQGLTNQSGQYYAGLKQNQNQYQGNLGWQQAQFQYLQNLLPWLTAAGG